jgi:DNA (cytosine-5)-methyltransferase 1
MSNSLMNYATVCSGIGAPEVAWNALDNIDAIASGIPYIPWRQIFASEIEPFPSAVLEHHYPGVPNYGDMTKYKEWPDHELGLICGGTPCQSFSIAGLRKGMDDPRGNLTLVFLGLLARYNPRWFVWENVPGVFSSRSNGSSDFGRFLSALAELGYGYAYRVLDAQCFGVPQRRRRVFVVGHIGNDWRPPFAVLSEPESLRGHTPQGGKAGEGTAGNAGKCFEADRRDGIRLHGDKTPTLQSFMGTGGNYMPMVMAHGQGNAEICRDGSPSLTCNHEAPIAFMAGQGAKAGSIAAGPISPTLKGAASGLNQCPSVVFENHPADSRITECKDGIAPTLKAETKKGDTELAVMQPLAFKVRCGCEGGGKGYLGSEDKAMTLSTGHDQHLFHNTIVRRLTPRECERLQGFPDDYTLIPWKKGMATDGHRYKALGNSMAVPVVRWIGRRIQMWEDLHGRT